MKRQAYPIEALLRPPVEWISSVAAANGAILAFNAPSLLLMTPSVAYSTGGILSIFACHRGYQGYRVVRYQKGLNKVAHYRMTSARIPHAQEWLFLGQGFRWTARHSQRLWDVNRPQNQHYLNPRPWYQRLIPTAPSQQALNDSGTSALHGVGLLEGEEIIQLPASERQGHMFYLGTTGVGKTRAAEIAITQDIANGHPTICMDPKGDSDLFRRMYSEAKRYRRPFYFFHLGYPKHSCRYNPIGRFSRITEVATRTTSPLPSQGNSAAFKQFVWLFTNIISSALVALGERPSYRRILQYMNHIEPLLVRYFEHYLDQTSIHDWRQALQADQETQGVPKYLKNRDPRALALVKFYKERGLYDPVADGLRRAFEYEKSFFDKIIVSVQPLLEKLLSGATAELINPNYSDTQDTRPILEWPRVIRQGAVVYCGFDALTDNEVASVVSQSMVADLVAYLGEIYKHGLGEGLPETEPVPTTYLHLDEVAELVGANEIIQAANKGRGAGLRISAYAQTLADLPAGMGSRETAHQLLGNITNTLVVMRVADVETAELLTQRLPQVEVNALANISMYTDSSNPDSGVDFTSTVRDDINTQVIPMLEPNALMQLPRGHAFILMRGGQLYKARLPLLSGAIDLPADLDSIARDMARRYHSVGSLVGM